MRVTDAKSLLTFDLPYSCPRVIIASEDDHPYTAGKDAVGLSKSDRGELASRHVKDHRGRVAQDQVHVHICCGVREDCEAVCVLIQFSLANKLKPASSYFNTY